MHAQATRARAYAKPRPGPPRPLQPENAVQIKPWKLEAGDTALLDMLPFLEAVFRADVPDVRSVVESYKGSDDVAAAFKDRLREAKARSEASKGGGRRGLLAGVRGG